MINTLKLLLLFLFLQNFGSELLAQSKTYKITIFDNKGFNGGSKSYTITGEPGDTKLFRELGEWDNKMSSIEVSKDLKVSLYRNKGANRDDKKYLVMCGGGMDHLKRWNDDISSLKLEILKEDTPVASFYDLSERKGTYQTLGPGKYDVEQLLLNDAVSGLEVSDRLNVTLYDDKEYTGPRQVIIDKKEDKNRFLNLNHFNFNDRTSSIEVKLKEYALISTKYLPNPKTISKSSSRAGTDVEISNLDNNSEIQQEQEISYTSTTTRTTSYSNSIATGLTVTATLGSGEAAPVKKEVSVSLSVEHTHTWGEETSKEESVLLGSKIIVTLQPHSVKNIVLTVTRAKLEYDVVFVYAPIVSRNGDKVTYNQDESTWEKIKEKVIVDKATKVFGQAVDITPKGASTNTNNNTSSTTTKIGFTGVQLTATNNNLYTLQKDGSIFKYVNNQWSKIGGYVKNIAANKSNFYYMGTDGSIFKYNGTGSNYTKIGGYGLKITSTNDILYSMTRDGSIFKYVNNQWVKIGGYAKDIATSNGNFYYMQNEGSIYKYNGTGSNYTKIGGYGKMENWTNQIKDFNQNTIFGSTIYSIDSSGEILKNN
jgi:hypothetical protein